MTETTDEGLTLDLTTTCAPEATPDACDAAPLSPEARAAFDRLLELEDRQRDMRARAAEAERDAAAQDLALESAHEALSAAEAAEIVTPGDDSTAAANAARECAQAAQEARDQAARAARVLAAEASKLDDAIDTARREAYRLVTAELALVSDGAEAAVRAKLGELVPELRRKAQVIDALARIEGGLAGVTFSVGQRLKEIQDVLVLAGEAPKSWQDEPDELVATLRGFAAYCGPRPEVVQDAWLPDSLRERFAARR